MPNIKTAISLEQGLFSQVEELAHAMNISRSRVFALAAEEFLKRRRSDQITQQLNEAYTAEAEAEDRETVRQMRPAHCRLAEAEW